MYTQKYTVYCCVTHLIRITLKTVWTKAFHSIHSHSTCVMYNNIDNFYIRKSTKQLRRLQHNYDYEYLRSYHTQNILKSKFYFTKCPSVPYCTVYLKINIHLLIILFLNFLTEKMTKPLKCMKNIQIMHYSNKSCALNTINDSALFYQCISRT